MEFFLFYETFYTINCDKIILYAGNMLKMLFYIYLSQKNLDTRQPIEVILAEAEEIIEISDDILTCCYIYMDFLHPVLLDIERKGDIDQNKINALKESLNQKLAENEKKLHIEYAKLTSENNTEKWNFFVNNL